MGNLDNGYIIHHMVYPHLLNLGLKQNREKFTLPEAGHRAFSVDVGSSYGEVLLRVLNDTGSRAKLTRISITSIQNVDNALARVSDLVSDKRAGLPKEGSVQ
jgi:hypothetical protein